MVGGWFLLRYGWGVEVARWPVLIIWGLMLSIGLAPLNGWIMRGKEAEHDR